MIKHKLGAIGIFTGVAAIVLGNSLSITSGAAYADLPGKHPFYLHALSDLRAARWAAEHRKGDAAVSGQEDVTIQHIDDAINEIKKASIDDGKNLTDHPHVDVPNDHLGRLHKVLQLLNKAHADVAREEDDPTTRGLRNRATHHIDAAIAADKRAIYDVNHHK